MKHLQCVVIGNSVLARHIIALLIEMGQSVDIVCTTARTISDFCADNNIPVLNEITQDIDLDKFLFIVVDASCIIHSLLKGKCRLLMPSIQNLAAFRYENTDIPYQFLGVWTYKDFAQTAVFSKAIPLTKDVSEQAFNILRSKVLITVFEELIVNLSRCGDLREVETQQLYSNHVFSLPKKGVASLKMLSDDLNIRPTAVFLSLVSVFFSRYFSNNTLPLILMEEGHDEIQKYVGAVYSGKIDLMNIDFFDSLKKQVTDIASFFASASVLSLMVDKHFCPILPDACGKNNAMHFLSNCLYLSGETVCFVYTKKYFHPEATQFIVTSLLYFIDHCFNKLNSNVHDIHVLSDNQKSLIKDMGNHTVSEKVHAESGSTILDLFNNSVQHYPKNIALEYLDRKLTYADLNAISRRFSDYLIDLGVKQQQIVGIALPKTEFFFVAVLAVLKSNCIYLPIDIALPTARINHLLNDSKCEYLITAKHLGACFLNYRARKIFVEEINLLTDGSVNVNDPIPARNKQPALPCDHAYIIYTSGSTGKPKGVLVKHLGLVQLACTQIENFKLKPTSRVLQFSNVSFDASVLEWSIAFASAATLVVVDNKALIGDNFVKFLQDNHITFMHLPPTVLNTIVPQKIKHMETVVVGGEACSQKVVDNWIKYVNLYNSYGPTENTVCALLHQCDSCHPANTIGKPLSHVSAYVIDKYNSLAPPLVTGELLLGGLGVTSGYWGKTALTNEKFIHVNISPGRLYRTGDLVKLNYDGTFHYIGRTDNQIKLRGYRIELSEIEKAAEQYGAINQAVALVKGEQDKAVIILYYVSSTQEKSTQSTLSIRKHLGQILPSYMIPSFYLRVDSFPMTRNGKIDTAKLLSLPLNYEVSLPYLPGNKLEETVYTAFLSALSVTSMGENDNFFMLGGNSLRAVHLLAAIEDKLSIKLPMAFFFNSPTIESVVSFIKTNKVTDKAAIFKCNRRAPLPLSYAQNRLWFLYELEEKKGLAYNIPICFKIMGALQIDTFNYALNQLIDRHEVLRTVFQITGGKAYQLVLSKYQIDLPVEDISNNEVADKISQAFHYAFDITRRPPFIAKLFRLDAATYIFTFVQHNIITDGWSIGIFLDELSHFYNKALNKDSRDLGKNLEKIEYQYVDYCLWQKKSMDSPSVNDQIHYWKDHLDNFSELQMPTDYPRPRVATTNGDSVEIKINKKLTAQLNALAHAHTCSLYMVLLSGLSLLLNRYSGSDDFVIGTGVASRNQLFLEKIMGFFVNTLPLRIRVNKDSTYIAFLNTVKKVCVGAYANQDVPFDMIVDALSLVREPDRLPLFQIMFMFQDAGDDAHLDLHGLKTQEMDIPLKSAMFDLTFNVYKDGETIKIKVQYNTHLYRGSTVKAFLERLITLYQSIVANPNDKLKKLRITTNDERTKLQAQYNQTAISFESNDLGALLLNRLPHYYNSIAIKYRETVLTYCELDKYSNQLARKILSGRENTFFCHASIIVLLNKNTAYIVTLLSILKLGANYVPIDPSYPDERIQFIIKDTSACAIITDQQQRVQDIAGAIQIISPDSYNQLSDAPIAGVNRSPDSLCYIIYTSGSTGIPKGVCISDKNLCNLLQSFKHSLMFNAQHHFLSVTSPTFDIFALEIYLPLISGALCSLTPTCILNEPDKMITLIRASMPTHIQATPSLWTLIIDLFKDNDAVTMHALVGGEALNPSLAQKLLDKFNRVTNVYGPTETTVWSTYNNLMLSTEYDIIGEPIANTKCYVFDKYGELLPENIPGELFIGGHGVATSYLNNAVLSKHRFVDDPFQKGERLYRTGDVVWRDDVGRLHYINRVDHQVKIRGHRIEMGEIEHVAMQHCFVEQAVAIAPKNEKGESNLILLFFTTQEDTEQEDTEKEKQSSANALSDFLASKLPSYMIPNQYIKLDYFPLTTNGKINRNALHVRAEGRDSMDGQFSAPKTPHEKIIAKIWSDLLNVKNINCNANFFVIGGHSLLVPQILLTINEALKTNITIREFIQHPSVSRLANYIEKRGSHKVDNAPVEIG